MGAPPPLFHAHAKDGKNTRQRNFLRCTTRFKIKLKFIQRSETETTQGHEKGASVESGGARSLTPTVEGAPCKCHKPYGKTQKAKSRWLQNHHSGRRKGGQLSRAINQAKQTDQQNPLSRKTDDPADESSHRGNKSNTAN